MRLVLRRFVPLLLALAVLASGRARAQPEQPRFTCFGTDEGLPHPTVTALLQERRGFLWVGTERGIARFDGHTFRRYTIPGDVVGEVSALLETPGGVLWIGTNQTGLYRLDTRTGRLRRASPPLPNVIARMEEGPGGRVLLYFNDPTPAPIGWVYLDGAGHLRPFRPRADVAVADVFRDASHRLWMLLVDASVYRLDPGAARWNPIPFRGSPGSVSADSSYFFALGAHPALRLDDGSVWTPAQDAPVLEKTRAGVPGFYRIASPARSGSALLRDGVWWEAWGHGLTAWHPARGARHYGPDERTPDPFPDTRTLAIAADRSGVLWIGTFSRGLCRLDPSPAPLRATSIRALAPRARADRLTTVYASRQGETFLGLEGGLLVRPPGSAAFRGFPQPLPAAMMPYPIKTAFRDRHGSLWLGSWGGGLWRLDATDGRWHGFTRGDASGFDAPAARVLHEDRRGRLWLGSEAGLRRYRPDSDTFTGPLGRDTLVLATAPIWALHEAADGILWVGTYQHGLCRFDPETAQERCYGVGEAVRAGGTVSALVPGPKGALYVGTYGGGLCRFTMATGAMRCLTEADGLLHDVILAMLPDARGRLWMSTQDGLSRFDPASETFQNFRLDGTTPRLELANGVGARLPSGHFLFGGAGGFVRFHPDSMGARGYRPPVHLMGVHFFDRDVPEDAPERQDGGVRVPPAERYVSFEFAALDLLAPERLRYRYRLDGFDPGWSEASAQRTATYTNLPPGTYTFAVQATNAAGIWSAVPLRVPVVVVPPFWARPWVRGLAGLLLALAFGALVRALSTRRLRARLRTLEAERRVQAERDRISRDLHDHVGAQMATVLSAAELVRLSARAGDDVGAQHYADVVAADARSAMQELRLAVESLRAEAVSPRELAGRLERDVRARLHLPDAPRLRVTVTGEAVRLDQPLAPAQAHQLYRITQEAVTNVLRHAGASEVEVRVDVQPGALRLVVQDDGAGLDPSSRRDAPRGGHGLRNMRARACEIGGGLTVKALPGGGTAVEATVPFA